MFITLTLFKTLNAMIRHLSTQHFRILYMDTGTLKKSYSNMIEKSMIEKKYD